MQETTTSLFQASGPSNSHTIPSAEEQRQGRFIKVGRKKDFAAGLTGLHICTMVAATLITNLTQSDWKSQSNCSAQYQPEVPLYERRAYASHTASIDSHMPLNWYRFIDKSEHKGLKHKGALLYKHALCNS